MTAVVKEQFIGAFTRLSTVRIRRFKPGIEIPVTRDGPEQEAKLRGAEGGRR
jgi:hypothetical protein